QPGDRHIITVHHPDAQRTGRHGPSDVVGSIQWLPDGRIRDVEVHPDFRRRGIATELYRRASEITPGLIHSDKPSPDGQAVLSRTASGSDGDRWVTCAQGHEHWGAHGAAGLLIRHRGDDGRYRYLLQKRSGDVDEPGTWSIPSGAIGKDESPEAGARREAREEIGALPQHLEHHHTVTSTDCGDWQFHTVVMDAGEHFLPRGGGDTEHETAGTAWHTAAEVGQLKADGQLHPAFADSWDKVRRSRGKTVTSAVEPYDEEADEYRPWHKRWEGETEQDSRARAERYVHQVAEKHDVGPEIARSALRHLSRDLDAGTPHVSARSYGFAEEPHGFGVNDEFFKGDDRIRALNRPELWDHVPVTHVSTDEIHASQNWVMPKLVAHNVFWPGKKTSGYDGDLGHPDLDPDDAPQEDFSDVAESERHPDLGRHALMVRRRDGRLQVADGHNRVAADMLLAKETTPAKVIDEDDVLRHSPERREPTPADAKGLWAHPREDHDRTRSEIPTPDEENLHDLEYEHDHAHEFEQDHLGHRHGRARTAAATEPASSLEVELELPSHVGAWREVTAAADEDEETTYYHVSPFRMQRGTVLYPREHGRGNFDDSSGEHTYMTPSPDRAEQYRYMLWEQGHPEQHMYQVRPHGPVEEDPNYPEAVRTKHKVTIDWLHDGDNDDWFDRGEPPSEPAQFPHEAALERREAGNRSTMISLDIPPGLIHNVDETVGKLPHITVVYLGKPPKEELAGHIERAR